MSDTEHLKDMEDINPPYSAIKFRKHNYKYIQTEDSFEKLRKSSLYFNEIRSNFTGTAKVILNKLFLSFIDSRWFCNRSTPRLIRFEFLEIIGKTIKKLQSGEIP